MANRPCPYQKKSAPLPVTDAVPIPSEPEMRRWRHPVEPVAASRDTSTHYIHCALAYQNQLLAENEYLELIYGAMIEAMYGDHPLVLRKYVQALREETRKSILDKSARAVKTMIAESSGKGREIIRLLENKLWFDKAAVMEEKP